TTALFHVLVEDCLEDFAGIKTLSFGGDAVSREHLLRACRALPGTRLTDGYGPTENTAITTCWTPSTADDLLRYESVPIGRPVLGRTVHILDETQQPVPAGEVGELYCGGDGVGHGYLNRPQLTAEKFISDPFSHRPGAKLYRTGDRARFLPDGNIEF